MTDHRDLDDLTPSEDKQLHDDIIQAFDRQGIRCPGCIAHYLVDLGNEVLEILEKREGMPPVSSRLQ